MLERKVARLEVAPGVVINVRVDDPRLKARREAQVRDKARRARKTKTDSVEG